MIRACRRKWSDPLGSVAVEWSTAALREPAGGAEGLLYGNYPMSSPESGPVILIGAARSGTKFLRDILNESEALARTPYDASYVWRYGNENRPDDAFSREDAGARVRGFALPTLRRMAGLGKTDDRRLLEKTVGNALRVSFVDEILPDARFIHLIRDGRAVTESAMRMWQAPPDWSSLRTKLRSLPLSNAGYALWFARNYVSGLLSGRSGGKVWGPRYPGMMEDAVKLSLEEVCAKQWTESVASARVQLAELPAQRVHTVRYEDMLGDPASLDALLDFLALPDADRVRTAFEARAARGNLDKWQASLSREQADTITRIAEPELTAFGYPLSDNTENTP